MSFRSNRFYEAETVVFWNLDGCPIPEDSSPALIDANIKLALKNLGYTGSVSIFAYTQAKQIKEMFDLVNIHLIKLDSVVSAGSMVNHHVCSWWGMVQRYEPKNLLVIAKEAVHMYIGFRHVKTNDNNLLLAHPEYTSEEIPSSASSIWLWDNLSSGGSPFYNRSINTASHCPTIFFAAETCVLWDLDKCPITEDEDLSSNSDNIKSALNNMGYTGQVSIISYSEHIEKDFELDGIKLIRLETNLAKYERMFLDACMWGMRNEPSNMMVISSKDIFDSDFIKALGEIKTKGCNILLALPHHPSKLLRDTASSIWGWKTLAAGGFPLDSQSESSYLVTPSPIIRAPLDNQSGKSSLQLASKKMKRLMKPCSKKRESRAVRLSKD